MSKVPRILLQLFLLSLAQYAFQEPKTFEDGMPVSITCELEKQSQVLWFRVTESGMEVIASVGSKGEVKHLHKGMTFRDGDKKRMGITNFNKTQDSGVYGCTHIQSTAMTFGKTTTLQGLPDPTTRPAPPVTTPMPNITTGTPCTCKTVTRKADSAGNCNTAIWAPLAGGCFLLLLVLIFTIRHCSRIRTRGCPHHYKRR
ncbi:T-cell surface glycoprotein CD8 alpha chain-like [Megalops cyprinoides]|uniref:T-cell surface glycoprotein CD8 alpha chain-like n=1 Tax=Megalops cyprinoides TaxID=118141 RepID=UPI001864AB2A|nr:T-cell surface glycoprotein CD8 alpha chain-like [Megalops cyprinoides]